MFARRAGVVGAKRDESAQARRTVDRTERGFEENPFSL
jgi:hypothetical protein